MTSRAPLRLSQLLAGLPGVVAPALSAAADPEIRGVIHDSRRATPGDLFVALVGAHHDGRLHAAQAVARGAVAVVGEPPAPADLDVPWIACERPRQLLGPLAARVFGHPDRELDLVGVTGTNGKSTVVTVLTEVLSAAGRPCGTLGTLGNRFAGKTYPGDRTTPEAADLFRFLRAMRDDGAAAAAMEVSSHALALGRVAGAEFAVGVFTNLTRDHLDFHRDLEDYFATKRQLFDQLRADGRAVVNIGDPYGRRLAAALPDCLTYGEGGDVAVRHSALDLRSIRALLATPRGDLELRSPLVGAYNLDNLLAVVAVCEALAVPHDAVAAALAARGPLPGRLEPVDAGQEFPVFVDFAHTPGALEAVLRSLRELGDAKIALVFGCGGDKDRGKRPEMGRIAGERADLVVATSDNPRTEDPMAILASVEQGLVASGNARYLILPDRREAIRRAVAEAGPGWIVLVAGKGHETEQIIGDVVLPFDDRQELESAIDARREPPSAEIHRG